jgi:hypothetical protein
VASTKVEATNDEYAAFVLRIVRALGRRGCADNGDLDVLCALARLEHEVDAALLDVVTRLRADPAACSWSEVGAALGVSAQAASKRFRKAGGVRLAGGQPSRWR